MPKFCPFMSENMTSTKAKNSVCAKSCALHLNGYCSIYILAQKAIKSNKKKTNDRSHTE